jgi:hypothetical protein
LNSFQQSSFIPGQAISGQCVFVSKDEVPWKKTPEPASSVSGTFCPEHYKTKATCQVIETSRKKGMCSEKVNCDAETGECEEKTWEVDAVPGTAVLTDGTREASCQVQIPAQECGAVWTGVVKMTGSCVLIEPKKVSAK